MNTFKVVGWLLILGLIGGLSYSLWKYPQGQPAPNILGASTGFEGAAPLPQSEIQPHFDHARTKMLEINSHGRTLSMADTIASWASFLSTALVTLILGYFGRRAPAANEPADQAGLSARTGRVIGVLAALAAVLTAGGALARNQARDDYDKASKAAELINATHTDLKNANADEARAALDKLDLEIGRL